MSWNIIQANLRILSKSFRTSHFYNFSTMMNKNYETLSVSIPKNYVYLVQLNRPEKLNALNETMWMEFRDCFEHISIDPDCRVVVLAGRGKVFCAGIDINSAIQLGAALSEYDDIARKCKYLEKKITEYQNVFSSIEKCRKPVIAAIHGPCIGAGLDMITAADIRYSSSDAYFQIKEVDLGLAADVGTLQRLPKIMGSESLVRELVYTARKLPALEALNCGLINRIFQTEQELLKKSLEIAEEIAKKSPVAVQESKISLVYSRDHSVQEGLDHIAIRNQAMLQSEDFINASMAAAMKDESPTFSKL